MYEGNIPTVIELKPYAIYFVEIYTSNEERLYGSMEIKRSTKLTELSNVKINLTQNIVDKVIDGQVSQITVNDPSEGKSILEFSLGNRIPAEMEKIYRKRKITKY